VVPRLETKSRGVMPQIGYEEELLIGK